MTTEELKAKIVDRLKKRLKKLEPNYFIFHLTDKFEANKKEAEIRKHEVQLIIKYVEGL